MSFPPPIPPDPSIDTALTTGTYQARQMAGFGTRNRSGDAALRHDEKEHIAVPPRGRRKRHFGRGQPFAAILNELCRMVESRHPIDDGRCLEI
jgi:hypothetical protein